MTNLTVSVNKKPPIDYHTAYINACMRSIKNHYEALGNKDKEAITRVVFYGIKTMIQKTEASDHEEALSDFEMIGALKQFIGELTPNEFMNMFPISKVYDGDRYEIKDYFYTRDYINKMDKEAPIGDKALELLMEYTNDDIDKFNLRSVMTLSALRRYDGHLDLMEEFLAADGMDTPNTFKNTKGEPMYVRHGNPTKIDSYSRLKLVK